jgi:DNA-binding transcriptional MerR regulator
MQIKRDIKEVKKMEFIRQSELAELNGVRPSTVKYYSELGLIPYTQHGEGLSRLYDRQEASKRLKDIVRLKKQGKSINEIISILLLEK